MQLASAIAAMLLVVPLLVLRLSGRQVNSRSYLATAVPFSLVTLGAGGVLTLAVRHFASLPFTLEIFSILAVLGSAVMLLRGAARRRELLRFMAAVSALGTKAGRADHIATMGRFLAKVPPGEEQLPSPHAARVLFAASALCQVGAYPEAEQLLEELPRSWLTARQIGPYVNALTIARLNLGDVEGAQQALDLTPEEELEPPLRAQLEALGALCASLSGEPDEALSLLASQSDNGTADLALLHTARAHAHAAQGDEDQAEAELTTLATELGPDVLSFAIDIEGPASQLAGRLRGGWAEDGEEPKEPEQPEQPGQPAVRTRP